MPTISELQWKSVERCNASFHPISSWSLCDWACAMAGECGEACNIVKKIRCTETRTEVGGKTGTIDLFDALADELADVVCYAALLAARAGVDLDSAVVKKFNEVSERVNSEVWL